MEPSLGYATKKVPPGADHWRKITVAGLLGHRLLEEIQNGGSEEDSHLTDLTVSGEEGHLTILLAHYIFGL